jgi:hypothetical protein
MEDKNIAIEYGVWLLKRQKQLRFKFIESNEDVFEAFLKEKKLKLKLKL